MRTQVRDLDFDRPTLLDSAVTVSLAWETLKMQHNVHVVPVTDEKGELYGMLSTGDIAEYDMRSIRETAVKDIPMYASPTMARLMRKIAASRSLTSLWDRRTVDACPPPPPVCRASGRSFIYVPPFIQSLFIHVFFIRHNPLLLL